MFEELNALLVLRMLLDVGVCKEGLRRSRKERREMRRRIEEKKENQEQKTKT